MTRMGAATSATMPAVCNALRSPASSLAPPACAATPSVDRTLGTADGALDSGAVVSPLAGAAVASVGAALGGVGDSVGAYVSPGAVGALDGALVGAVGVAVGTADGALDNGAAVGPTLGIGAAQLHTLPIAHDGTAEVHDVSAMQPGVPYPGAKPRQSPLHA